LKRWDELQCCWILWICFPRMYLLDSRRFRFNCLIVRERASGRYEKEVQVTRYLEWLDKFM